MKKLPLVLLIVSLMLNGYLLTRLFGLYLIIDNTQKELNAIRDRAMIIFNVDDSCFNQVKNSNDGIIRLQFNNKTK